MRLCDFFGANLNGDSGDLGDLESDGEVVDEVGSVSPARGSSSGAVVPASISGCGAGLRPMVSTGAGQLGNGCNCCCRDQGNDGRGSCVLGFPS